MNGSAFRRDAAARRILSVVLAFICILYILPVLAGGSQLLQGSTPMSRPRPLPCPPPRCFAGWANYIKGVTFGNYPFWKSAFYSLFITLVSTALILLCTSMAAWYISRVDSMALPRSSTTSASSPWSCRSRWSCSPSPRPPTA